MASFFTHLAVAGIGIKIGFEEKVPRRFWALGMACAVLADADVLAFRFGIPYAHFFGHRGFFHSITFSLAVSLILGVLFLRRQNVFSRWWWRLTGALFLIGVSHGILDCLTNGGLGIALFSPFDNSRYFFPYQWIEVSPIGIKRFFGPPGVRVLISEFTRVILPLLIILLVVKIRRRANSSPRVEDKSIS